ncbi:uncharacterized protein EI97DRAFT_370978 [Westerdykella ornata]|uniref:Nascent polypeptide-associated complex subunit alpha-like UBA domain-containing protein n=1 Tax=Westerdykella ornata TaxID=318751 RepID=A0A6A6JTF9_WESOR|nr:uncharacterized protein EI97DRAFT_370978 [Westerdykella ornata]KAF2279545.1 hypothetical protein EI97DRAFT_370978 [Westerdykella ornata]
MAESPQPPTIHEGASGPHAPTSTAEDRKAAAALSSLDAPDDDSAAGKKDVDPKALGEAMKNLSVTENSKAGPEKAGPEKKNKTIRIEPADVTLLVSQLDISKAKATELLRSVDGDTVKAMTAFITATI